MKSRHGGPSDVPEGYDPSKFDRPSVTVDIILFTVKDGCLMVLLIQRKYKPCAGMWAFPGGFVDMEESLDDAARRELKEETGLDNVYIEQLRTYGDPDRDPRTRVITIAYLALAPAERLKPCAGDDAAEAEWFPAYDPPELAFDHEWILADALDRLRDRLTQAPVAFELLTSHFTIIELRKVFEAVLQKQMDERTVRRRISSMGRLIRCDKDSSRPGSIYRFEPDKS